MKIIEDWIDSKLTSLVACNDGFIVLTNEDIAELAQALGLSQKPVNFFMAEAIRDYVYFQVDQHRDYFQKKREEFSNEYAQEQSDTEGVMQSCQ